MSIARIFASLKGVLASPVRQKLATSTPAEIAAGMAAYYQSGASNEYYGKLDAKGQDDDIRDMERRRLFIKLCSSSRTILDLGCGTGNLAIAVARRFPSARVYGIDIGQMAGTLGAAKDLPENVELRSGDLLKSGYPDSHFDMVISRFVIEHVVYPQQMLQEAHRMIRSGGLLYLVYPHLLLTAETKAKLRELASWITGSAAITYLEPDFTGTPCADKDAVWLSNSVKVCRMMRKTGFRIVLNHLSQSLVVGQKE